MSNASSIKMLDSVSRMAMRQFIQAAPILANWRNSKGRLMPLHIKSAPGVGKNMLVEAMVQARARIMPGVPVGCAVANPGVMTPADVAGFVLFDTLAGAADADGNPGTKIKTSVYTRPTLFAVRYALIYDATTDSFERVTLDDYGNQLYVGCLVQGQPLTNGYLLLDEFDQADVEVRKVCAPLLDEGRITTHFLPDGWGVMCASNRAKDASGTGRGLAFLTNRVCHIELMPDVSMVEGYLCGEDTSATITPVSATMPLTVANGRVMRDPTNSDSRSHPAVLAFMRQNQDALFAGVPSDPNVPFLTPRSLEAVSNLFDVLLRLPVADASGAMDATMTFADSFIGRTDTAGSIEGITGTGADRWSLFQALAGGTIGTENTAQFLATLELFEEVPSLAAVAADPAKAHVSTKRDAQLITAYLLSNGMTPNNADACMKYAKRLDPALYQNVVHNAVSRDGMLMMARAIAAFLTENPDAMLAMTMARAGAQAPGRKIGR